MLYEFKYMHKDVPVQDGDRCASVDVSGQNHKTFFPVQTEREKLLCHPYSDSLKFIHSLVVQNIVHYLHFSFCFLFLRPSERKEKRDCSSNGQHMKFKMQTMRK